MPTVTAPRLPPAASGPEADARPDPMADPTARRQGPRPLALHLATQGWTFLTSYAGLMRLSGGWPTSTPDSGSRTRSAPGPDPAEALRRTLESVAAEHGAGAAELARALEGADARLAFLGAVDAEARRRFESFLRGIQRYRAHPYKRTVADPPVIWRRGTTGLRDYRGTAPLSPRGEGRGAAVLVVPSLVNRGYVLDLTERRSFMRYLAGRGFRPFLVDWDAPGEEERDFGCTEYVHDRLSPLVDAVRAETGARKIIVVGYCMGGTLSLPLAQARPDAVGALVTLAAPWDFHAGSRRQQRVMAALGDAMGNVVDVHGVLPVDLLQSLFATLDPGGIPRKFRAFDRMRPRSAKARDFVALEDWLNDGVALAGPLARETLFGWYAENGPGRGAWTVGDSVVDPGRIAAQTLVVVPSRDRIVPPESAEALLAACPKAEGMKVPLGHVGMMTGRRAGTLVYGPLARWMGRAARRCAG
ncbi:alpha/beta fold hydrolase [Caenispirillum salinarum]|uniref:alpha/beta fold hydrolase n=1 Tax=Caenispirillum salinarum TaxID=859058 RepID=UPI00384D2CD0